MGESVEQAALRRAQGRDDADALISLMNRIVLTVEGLNALDDCRRDDLARHDREIAALHAENAELRDAILVLSNRIEAATRNAQMPERPCPRFAVVHEPHVYRRGEDVFLCLGVKS